MAQGAAAKRDRNCSITRTMALLSDGWGFMILRECYFGVKRFDAFQQMLGVSRGTLTSRLRKLCAQGLLRQVPYSDKPPRDEYRLTKVGFDLYPVMIALMSYGDRWLAGKREPPLALIHEACGNTCHPHVACSGCAVTIDIRAVQSRDGPGAGTALAYDWAGRRSADPTALERRRPSSVARTLKFIGDRWSFLVLREAFFGVRRFDELRARLGIAPNILTDRLGRLVREDMFIRERYSDTPERFEYRLTDKGRELAGPLLAMLRWGDRWLAGGEPPLLLRHKDCGADFEPRVVCDRCGGAIEAGGMRYEMNYRAPRA